MAGKDKLVDWFSKVGTHALIGLFSRMDDMH